MSIAAVRRSGQPMGPVMIVHAEGFHLAPGASVKVEHGDLTIMCTVVATGQAILGACTPVDARIIAVDEPACDNRDASAASALAGHPAARLPALGEMVATKHGAGSVSHVDVVAGRVMVVLPSGGTIEISREETRREP